MKVLTGVVLAAVLCAQPAAAQTYRQLQEELEHLRYDMQVQQESFRNSMEFDRQQHEAYTRARVEELRAQQEEMDRQRRWQQYDLDQLRSLLRRD